MATFKVAFSAWFLWLQWPIELKLSHVRLISRLNSVIPQWSYYLVCQATSCYTCALSTHYWQFNFLANSHKDRHNLVFTSQKNNIFKSHGIRKLNNTLTSPHTLPMQCIKFKSHTRKTKYGMQYSVPAKLRLLYLISSFEGSEKFWPGMKTRNPILKERSKWKANSIDHDEDS